MAFEEEFQKLLKNSKGNRRFSSVGLDGEALEFISN